MTRQARLRMFAGPNGSGKSTLKDEIAKALLENDSARTPEDIKALKDDFEKALLGIYVNADEIEKELNQSGALLFEPFKIKISENDIIDFFNKHPLIKKANLQNDIAKLRVANNVLHFDGIAINSYWAAALADFIRRKLLAAKTSFSFETVMSSRDKVEFLKEAKSKGFRTYLYFVATEDPDINISRVAHRVKMGGHPVPQDKIINRYHASLDLLIDALPYTDRAYIFDNSSEDRVWIAEITEGNELEFKCEKIPRWFEKAILEKLT